MMKRIKLLAVSAGICCSMAVMGQTSQNFNSSSLCPLNLVKSDLQNHCWIFPGFDVNKNGWSPAIEGDGAMVSDMSCTASQQSGIITPMLEVAGSINVHFKYKLSAPCTGGSKKWLKIALTDFNNNLESSLDSIDISGAGDGQVHSYTKSLPGGSGCYRLFINYQGTGGQSAVAIDDLQLSVPFQFATGCSQAPLAVDDAVNGLANHHASGNVSANDVVYTPYTYTSCYLAQNSPDGNVVLNEDGSFTFTPNPGFSGNRTQFTYTMADNSVCSPLSSNEARVVISFPSGSFLPISMIDFKGVYRDGGKVELTWTTTFEQNSKWFEIERSLDGNKWETAGKVDAAGTSAINRDYSFTDNAGVNRAIKNDLYYRLKMVDLDSKTAVSRILVVRVYNTRALKMISVTPNPARNDIAATVQLNSRAVVVLKVVSSNGREMMRKTVTLNEGTNTVLMDGTSNLQPGPYFLEMIVNSKERMIVKLIKE